MKSPVHRYAGLEMSDLFRNPALRAYLANVRGWHGYVRFLGLPDRRDRPDVEIGGLFVWPLLTRRHVSPDENPDNWRNEAERVLDALMIGKPLMLLGRPRLGEDPLLNYLVWLLGRPSENVLIDRQGWRLPVPMVLREMRLRGVTDFDGLPGGLSGPCDERALARRRLSERDARDGAGVHPARRHRRGRRSGGTHEPPPRRIRRIRTIPGLPLGVVFTDRGVRRGVLRQESVRRGAVGQGARFALRRTGGVRGRRRILERSSAFQPRQDVHAAGIPRLLRRGTRDRRYPRRHPLHRALRRQTDHLLRPQVVHPAGSGGDPGGCGRLPPGTCGPCGPGDPQTRPRPQPVDHDGAHPPHRDDSATWTRAAVRPHRGGVLESIDKFRGLYSGAHDLPQKKFWLARVGYEMQRRRALAEETDGEASTFPPAFQGGAETPDGSEILVDSDAVLDWLAAEMERGGATVGVDSPEEFLDFVGRRSGLFLPRGEGRYAFIHLSFQEYFAAVALERDVTGIDWARGKRSPLGFFREDLAKWGGTERLARDVRVSLRAACPQERLARRSAGLRIRRGFFAIEEYAGARRTDTESGFPCARLAINLRSGLAPAKTQDAIDGCVRTMLRCQSAGSYNRFLPDNVFGELLGDDREWNAKVLDAIGEQLREAGDSRDRFK